MLIHIRAVIEVLGKPQEHVEESMKRYLASLRESKQYKVLHEEFAEAKKQPEGEYWATFAEVEVSMDKLEHLTNFCFEYMPSLIEIIQPNEMVLSGSHLSAFLNDLQAKLHQVDLVAKNLRLENSHLKQNQAHLLQNYVVVLLSKGNLDSEHLSQLTGVSQEVLEDFLDQLIDEGKIDLKEGIYFLTQKEPVESLEKEPEGAK